LDLGVAISGVRSLCNDHYHRKANLCDIHSATRTKMVLLRQQNYGPQMNFLLLQPKILLQQPNVLLLKQNIFAIPISTNDFAGVTKPFFPCITL